GFLRIRGGDDPLDCSAVHPESYPVVRRILAASGTDITSLIGNTALLRRLRPADFLSGTVGLPTVTDILAELDKPGRDPRPSFVTARFADGIEKVADLKPGMVLEGVVTNVAAFGAFVDVGVHQDGLVHVSALANRFVSDPREVVKSGDVVRVKVLSVDEARKRISLTLRLDDEVDASGRPERGRSGGRGREQGGQAGGGQEGQRGGRQDGGRGGRQGGQRGGPQGGADRRDGGRVAARGSGPLRPVAPKAAAGPREPRRLAGTVRLTRSGDFRPP